MVRSDSQKRPLRTTLEFDPISFEQVREKRFSDGALIDCIVGVGTVHEGLFG